MPCRFPLRSVCLLTSLAASTEIDRPADGADPPPRLVKDLNPSSSLDSAPREFVRVGNAVYFTADDGIQGREVWRTDGTADGTSLVVDLLPGPNSGPPRYLTAAGDVFYFEGTDGRRFGLWKTDGTAEGTTFVAGGPGGPSHPDRMTPAGDLLFFAASDTAAGQELWVSDGTSAGTRRVKDLMPGPDGSVPHRLAPVGRRVFFVTGGRSVGNLWASDGTEAGTVRLTDYSDDAQVRPHWTEFAAIGDALYFVAPRNDRSLEVWKSDGTPEGTVPITSLGPLSNGSGPGDLTAVGETLYFTAHSSVVPDPDPQRSGDYGHELWKSDGTPEGTAMVVDLQKGPRSSLPHGLAASDGRLYFTAGDGTGRQVWTTDGTAEGTVRASLSRPAFCPRSRTSSRSLGRKSFSPAAGAGHGRAWPM